MSSTIDERVVAMKFQNSDFNSKIKSTLDSLASLKGALNMDAGRKSIEDLDAAGKKFNLTSMGDATDGISAKFIAMATIAITSIANITNRAVDAGIQMAKSLTIDPIKSGLAEYETNLNSIQTILSNTSTKGTTLDQVNAALQELNNYSDKTIYNFSEMARNIGTFTAAGVDLDTSVNAIKGVANLAAISGSSSQQASTAMYQLSQALATGTVKLMDWNSVVNAGMGGEVFQNALKETARAHGVAVDDMIAKNGSFRDSLQEGWLSAEILTETLSKFTGDLSAEQLKQMGYTDEQIAGILEMGKTAMHAAQDVKTFSQLLDTTKEAVGSGWSQTWQIVFGDFGEAKELWTSVSNAINGVVGASADARNKMLQDWKTLGGRTALIETIKNVLAAISNIIAPIRDAFRQVFPPTTGAQLYNITKALLDFSQKLKDGTSGLESIKPLFTALFSVLKFGLSIIQAAAKGIGILLGLFVGGAGAGIIGIANSLAVIVQRITDWVAKTGLVEKFFTMMAEARAATLGPIIDFVNRIMDAFASLASGDYGSFIEKLKNSFMAFAPWGDKVTNVLDTVRDAFGKVGGYARGFGSDVQGGFGKAAQYVANVADAISGFASRLRDEFGEAWSALFGLRDAANDVGAATASAGDRVREAWSGLGDVFRSIGDFLAPAKEAVGNGLTWLKDKITEFISGLDVQDALALVNTGLFMSMYLGIKSAMDSLEKVFDGIGNFVNPLSSVFNSLSGALKGLQNEANAKAILNIAIAVGVLAGTAMALSLVDPASLGVAGGAIVALIGTLVGTMFAFEKIAGDAAVVKIGALAGALVLISNAVIILAGAIAIFGAMDPASVGIGLGFMTATLAVVIGAVFALSKITASMISSAAGLVILSVALTAMAGVISLYSLFDIATIAEGIGYMAATLAALGLAMQFMPPNMLLTSVALVAVAVALGMLSGTLKIMATMSFGDIAKSLITLAASLGIIAVAMIAMTGTLAGAAALMVTTLALGMFVPILVTLGQLDLQTIGIGLLAIAGVFAVIGVAGLLLGPVVPVLMGLGIALSLMGVGALAAGAGIFAFANAIGILAGIGAVGMAAVTAVIVGIAELFPLIMQQLGLGLRAFAVVISESGPEIVGALTTLLISLLQAIDNAAPQFFETTVNFLLGLLEAINVVAPEVINTLVILIEALLDAIVELVPEFVDAGMKILIGFLDGIANNIHQVIDSATDVVVNFIDGIADNLSRIIQSGFDLLISFLNGIENAIRENSQRMIDAGMGIGDAIIDGVKNAITSGVSRVTGAVKNLGTSALNGLKNIFGIASPSKEFYKLGEFGVQGLKNAFDDNHGMVNDATSSLGKDSLASLKNVMKNAADSFPTEPEINPVVTPVLDLTQFVRDASQIDRVLGHRTINASVSADRASILLSDDKEARRIAEGMLDAQGASAGPNVTYIQNNNSPKALPNIEIYRQTKSQLAGLRGALVR